MGKWTIIQRRPEFQGGPHRVSAEGIVVGREEDTDIQLLLGGVSRHHCRFFQAGGKYYVEDLQSTNGTWLRAPKRWQRVEGIAEAVLPGIYRLGNEAVVEVHHKADEQAPKTEAVAPPIDLAGMSSESSMSISQTDLATIEQRVALCVVDLCESTAMGHHEGEMMGLHLKKRFEDMARGVLAHHPAKFYKSTGDGFLSTFTHAPDALCVAIRLLVCLHERNSNTTNPPINIRVGLHDGIAYTMEGPNDDIHGNDVNTTFRIEGLTPSRFTALKHGFKTTNRILCSGAFYRKLLEGGTLNSESLGLEDIRNLYINFCGPAQLKGIPDPVDIYTVEGFL